jgi:hypothetical protein
MKNKKINKVINNNINTLNQNKYTIFNQLDDNDEFDKEIQEVQEVQEVQVEKPIIVKKNNCDKKDKNIIDLVNNENFQQIVENISLENFGTKKLNTKWTLWFHHNPNDWQISGYKKIHTFETIDDYLQIMSYLHMITSIKNINLYLFRDNIEPTWEDKANSNGGCWSIKILIDAGFNLWHKICNKAITENLLKQFSDRNEDNDINGTINGISITNKSMNTIIKIWVSDRKVSNYQWLDTDIINMVSSKIMYQVISPEKH